MYNQKRPRTDGSGESDWTCASCGNVNFSFRSSCNMRKCGAPKPANLPPVPVPVPMQPPFGQPGGPGGLPMQAPGMVYDGQAQTPYMGGAAFMGAGGGAPPLIGGPLGGSNPFDPSAPYLQPQPFMPVIGGHPYGAPPMDPFRPMGGGLPMVDGQRKRRGGPDSSAELPDWICPKCGNTNFGFRTQCNMRKCGEPRPAHLVIISGGGGGGGGYGHGGGGHGSSRPSHASEGPPPDGSWTCKDCGNVNYPFRTHCNRRNCGKKRSEVDTASAGAVAAAAATAGSAGGSAPAPTSANGTAI